MHILQRCRRINAKKFNAYPSPTTKWFSHYVALVMTNSLAFRSIPREQQAHPTCQLCHAVTPFSAWIHAPAWQSCTAADVHNQMESFYHVGVKKCRADWCIARMPNPDKTRYDSLNAWTYVKQSHSSYTHYNIQVLSPGKCNLPAVQCACQKPPFILQSSTFLQEKTRKCVVKQGQLPALKFTQHSH